MVGRLRIATYWPSRMRRRSLSAARNNARVGLYVDEVAWRAAVVRPDWYLEVVP